MRAQTFVALVALAGSAFAAPATEPTTTTSTDDLPPWNMCQKNCIPDEPVFWTVREVAPAPTMEARQLIPCVCPKGTHWPKPGEVPPKQPEPLTARAEEPIPTAAVNDLPPWNLCKKFCVPNEPMFTTVAESVPTNAARQLIPCVCPPGTHWPSSNEVHNPNDDA